MSKIFRLHTGGTDDISHWTEITGHLNDAQINTISDPSNATAHSQITSIPSPYARMDLVRTAFAYVNNHSQPEANTIYHKIVSDCWDVAELFFNIEALGDKIETIEWRSGITMNGGELTIEPESDLGAMIGSPNPKHRLLAETLQMFLFQDARSFNFARLSGIYLLNYKQGPEPMNIIGGTSPATLFFSAANKLSFVDIELGNHRLFSDFYCPLHERGDEFIKYIYQFRLAFQNFADTFPDIDAYLDYTYLSLNDELKAAIRAFTSTSYHANFTPICVGSENNNAEILSFVLRARNFGSRQNNREDFSILTNRTIDGPVPLLLPTDAFSEPMAYAGGEWQRNYHLKVPKFDPQPLNERKLPNYDHIRYPYLTISDLLEPYIVRLPFPVDTEKFFMGGYQGKAGQDEPGFALPIKRKYFEYFTIADLQGVVQDGKKRFEIQKLSDGVVVTLRVPVQNNQYVTLSRIYSPSSKSDGIPVVDEKANIGYILDHQVTLAIYPFIKTGNIENAHYRIMLAERDYKPVNKSFDAGLKFYREDNSLTSIGGVPQTKRSSKEVAPGVSTTYYMLESEFDFIELSQNAAVNLLIPIFPPKVASSRVFKFAIDFGTTNTHIEYQVNNEDPKPFEIRDDIHVATLHQPGQRTENFFSENVGTLGLTISRLTTSIQEEFLPFRIAEGSDYKFPQRTVIYDNDRFSQVAATYALADFNIPFWYLKGNYNQLQNSGNEVTPNLKWADFGSNTKLEKRTKGFLKQIMLMLRNKVLINNGVLAATEVVLFYPSSMPTFRRRFLQDAWHSYYQRYFPGANGLYQLSESFAPFRYFAETAGVVALDRPATCIDIGGGTSDIVIYTKGQPQILTSFQFASNSLFGDGYGNTAATNGFVQKYEKIIKDGLTGTKAVNLTGVYDAVKQKNTRSIELIEFFFAIEENKSIIDNKIPLAFSKLLAKDTDFKVVFLLYYAAIIYHVAMLMKLKGLQMPRYLTFSGNGSKVIGILAGGHDLSILTDYTRLVFESVYGVPYEGRLEIKLYPNPKELTCKGGLLIQDYQQFNELEEKIREVLLGDEKNTMIPETKITYQQMDNQDTIDSVQRNVISFIDLFFQWNDKFNYYNKFGISPANFDRYKEVLKEDLKAFLIAGINEKQRENRNNAAVALEETLFFYPLSGVLNKLAYQIYSDHA